MWTKMSASLLDCAGAETLIMIGTVVLLTLLLAEVFDWSHFFSAYDNILCSYGYGTSNGPRLWKETYPRSRGDRQSPINILTRSAIVCPAETLTPLKFSAEYHIPPKDIRAINDGHSVTIFARWINEQRPVINGGPITVPYQFFNARFRWGPNDEEGSEHTIDSMRYAMELQATFIKNECQFQDLNAAAEASAVLIVAYFFQVTPVDNPYLETLILALDKIRCPYSRVSLEPFPIAWLIPPFKSKYFNYRGSLTHPPCTEGVEWIIQPEPLTISARQVRKFRKMMSMEGRLKVNTRPVQEINCRDIFFYD